MPPVVKIWDMHAEGGPKEIELYSLTAKEALRNDPKRYSQHPPRPATEPQKGNRS